MRLDKALHVWGIAPSRSKAQELIRAGHVERLQKVEWQKCLDAHLEVDVDIDRSNFRLTDSTTLKFVSRGGLKLEGALDHLGISVKGLNVLDVGLSTGGFTDCLLQKGARSIVGVDVGHGQLADKLKGHPQLVSLEGVNARELASHPDMQAFKAAPFDLIVIDVSFISLSLILSELPPFLARPHGQVLALIKPQFELSPAEVGRSGVVVRPEAHQAAIARVIAVAVGAGFEVLKIIPSPISGTDGNQEFFVHLIVGVNGGIR